MLELASLSRAFGGLVVIDRVDFKVEAGEIVGILGPNGAGKTTLFNMIAGVLPPSGGRIVFAGSDITAHARVGSLPPRHRPHLSNSETFHPYERVRERAGGGGAWRQDGVAAGQTGSRSGAGKRRACAPRARFRPGSWRCSTPSSSNWRRRWRCGRGCLLLDEIAGGLTEAECDVLIGTIRKVHDSGVTIVWIEHVIQALRRVVSRLAVLAGGNFIAMGAPQDVLADRRVKEAYLGT